MKKIILLILLSANYVVAQEGLKEVQDELNQTKQEVEAVKHRLNSALISTPGTTSTPSAFPAVTASLTPATVS